MVYWLADVAIEAILQSEYLEEDESDANYSPHGHSIFLVVVDEAVDLIAGIQIDFDEGVKPVEVDELLEQQRRSDFGL